MLPTAADEEDDAPPMLWYERMTPLMVDCHIAMELLHCTPGEYYRRTTRRERLLIRLFQEYRAQQERVRTNVQRQRAEAERMAREQAAKLGRG